MFYVQEQYKQLFIDSVPYKLALKLPYLIELIFCIRTKKVGPKFRLLLATSATKLWAIKKFVLGRLYL